jgi:hypothetical protein
MLTYSIQGYVILFCFPYLERLVFNVSFKAMDAMWASRLEHNNGKWLYYHGESQWKDFPLCVSSLRMRYQ